MRSRSDYISTNDVPEFLVQKGVSVRSRNSKMVAEFRRAMGQHVGVIPDSSKVDFGLHIANIRGEIDELEEAVAGSDPAEQLDAMADTLYFLYGLALDCGFDLDAAMSRVHEANMAKMGPDGVPIKDENGRVVKPEGWMPPDLSDLVGVRAP